MASPSLRFLEYYTYWQKTILEDNCSFFSGGTPTSTNKSYYKGLIPFIGSGDIHNSDVKSFITEEALINSSAKIVSKGDLLYALYGANSGDVALSQINGAINQAILCIKSKDVDLTFLLNLLANRQGRIVSKYLQGGQGNLSAKIIKKLSFFFPSLPEQQKIASFLSTVDAKIEQLTKKITLLQTYKKGVIQKLFSQETRFKREDGSDYPDWEEKRLESIFERIKTKNTKNYKTVLTISAQQGLVSQEEFFNKSVASKDLSNYYVLKKGDFSYNKSYSNGYPMGAIKRLNNYAIGVVSPIYICFLIKSGNAVFYEKYFDSGLQNREIQKLAQEGARNHGLLNISVIEFFKDIKVPYPSIIEQEKIAAFLTAIDKKIELVNTQLKQSKEFKKGLLQQMFV